MWWVLFHYKVWQVLSMGWEIYCHKMNLKFWNHSWFQMGAGGSISWGTSCQQFATLYYAPNFEEVEGAYWFWVVPIHPCIHYACHILWTMHARVLKFHIYGFLMENYLTHFFFLSELSPFLELCPFEKIRMKSDACHILWTVHARVLNFHLWIPHGKIAHLYFFSCPSYRPFLSCTFEKIRMKSCQQEISKNVWVRGLKLVISW